MNFLMLLIEILLFSTKGIPRHACQFSAETIAVSMTILPHWAEMSQEPLLHPSTARGLAALGKLPYGT
jgi:hypothetical protein